MSGQLTVVVTTTPGEYEYVSDRLWALGVVAISEHWSPEGVVTLRTSLGDDEAVADSALERAGIEYRFEYVDASVAETWRDFARPVRVGDHLIVRPTWCDEEAVSQLLAEMPDPDSVRVVSIEPGSTFGLGDHPTTMASLEMIHRYVHEGDEVLDVGCGSGVLGIVALLLGSRRAHGVDINPASVAVSNANASANGVADRWSVSNDALDVIGRPFDLVVANILAPVLIELGPSLKRLTAPGGSLVVSGVLQGHYDHVSAALSPMREFDRIEHDGWVAVVYRH